MVFQVERESNTTEGPRREKKKKQIENLNERAFGVRWAAN